LKKKSEIKN